MKVSDLPVAEVRKEEVSVGEGEGGVELEDGKGVTVVADAWGQGVVVIPLGREINDNGVENQAKLIIYVHQTILTFKNVLYNTGTFLYHKSIFLNAEHDNPVHVRAAGVIYKLITI
jgi:hypothetical protein